MFLGIIFASSMDVRLLLGVLLYFVFSKIAKSAFRDFGSTMSNNGLVFFTLEHAHDVFLAVAFAPLGSTLSKKGREYTTKHKRTALWFELGILTIFVGMPWFRPLSTGF